MFCYAGDENRAFDGQLPVTIQNLGVTDAFMVVTGTSGILAAHVGAEAVLKQCWTSGYIEKNPAFGGVGALIGNNGRSSQILNCSSSAQMKGYSNVGYGRLGSVWGGSSHGWIEADTLVNYLFTGSINKEKADVNDYRGSYQRGYYSENVYEDGEAANITHDGHDQNGIRNTAWLQSKEYVNLLNATVERWNAENDEARQLNFWQWREGDYPVVSSAADYNPGYAVIFESNGGSEVVSMKAVAGSTIQPPMRPTKENQLFAGWYKDEALTQLFKFGQDIVEEDMTLYARWLDDVRFDYDITPFSNKRASTYHIKTAAQLRGFAYLQNGVWEDASATTEPRDFTGKTIVLDNDIFLNDTTDWQQWGKGAYAVPWRSIGTKSNGYMAETSLWFKGTFDGQGHVIYGMYVERGGLPSLELGGLFYRIGDGATIQNLGIEASVLNLDMLNPEGQTNDERWYYWGNGSYYMENPGMLDNLLASETTVSQCYTLGTIYMPSDNGYAGALTGRSAATTTNCYARVDIYQKDNIAYESGFIFSPNEYLNMTNCYNAGKVHDGMGRGGYGLREGLDSYYFDKELINNVGYSYDILKVRGRTTNEMMAKSTYEGWDFETIWGISSSINDGYPFLRQFHPDFKEDAVLITAPAAVEGLVYTGEPLVLITAGVAEGGEMQFALSADGEFSATLPTATYPGDYTVYYKVVGDDSHNSLPIAGPIIVTINKAAGVISFAESSMSKTYGDADFTNTLTNTGDGTVTYTSNNENIATVNSETGLVTIMGAPGDVTITATVTDGTNYAYATTTATFTIGVNTAAIAVSAEGFTGTYDGASHTITVTVSEPEGTTVKYGTTAGEYTLDAAPTYTDAGEYTIYYQVTKANYTTVENSAVVSIQKAAASISYEATAVSKTSGDEAFINALTMTGDGTVTYSSDNVNVATVNSETGEVTIKGSGTATIKATVVDGTNYTYATKTAQYTLTVEAATGISDVKTDAAEKTKWYDLSGRPLNGKPTKAGVYVKNGKKIVIK